MSSPQLVPLSTKVLCSEKAHLSSDNQTHRYLYDLSISDFNSQQNHVLKRLITHS